MIQTLGKAAVAGMVAGLVALAFDVLLAYATLGYSLSISGSILAAYLGTGALFGLALGGVLLALGRRATAVRIAAAALVALYTLPIAERFFQALQHRSTTAVALVAVAVAVLGYLVWSSLLCRVARREGQALALLLAALSAAAGLAVNRNLVDRPFAPTSLMLDAAIALCALALAFLARRAGPHRAAAVVVALLLAAPAVGFFGHRPSGKAPTGDRPMKERPHLILVIIDTLRQDVFRAVLDETPEGQAFSDALSGAAFFDHAIAAAPWTVPSVGTIMTGLHPKEHGFGVTTDDPSRPIRRLADSVPTLAGELRRQGYQTAAIVTNPLLHPFSGLSRGFESYEILTGPTTKLPLATVLVKFDLLPLAYYQQADVVKRHLRRRLGQRGDDRRPLFLWLHLLDPHDPLFAHRDLEADPAGARLEGEERLYRDETRFALRELTGMFELLRRDGLFDSSLLVIVSDHGEMFPSDGHEDQVPRIPSKRRIRHGHALYGELVRVPLVLRPPGGLAEHRRVDVLASHADLFDTIADLIGVELPRYGLDRTSLAGWLARELPPDGLPQRDFTLASGTQHGPAQRALRTRAHKLIDYLGKRPQELYSLDEDPGELDDLAATDPELEGLSRKLIELWKSLRTPPEADAPDLDEDTRRRLEALGYL